MKRILVFTIVFYTASVVCAQQRRAADLPMHVRSDFDCGSIGPLVESPANVLTGPTLHWKHKTSKDDQYYWFYFQIDHVAQKRVTIKLDRLSGIYRGHPHLIYTQGTQPVYSYDTKHWERIKDVAYDSAAHTLTFRQFFIRDSVWVAYAHPYSFSMSAAFIRSLPHKSAYLGIDTLGFSAEGRPVTMLTISDPAVPDSTKKVVLITTLQHAGEYIGGFFVEGMTRYLLSDAAPALAARKSCVYKIVPMMNPDGIFHGMTRLNGNYEDLNQEWDDDFSDTAHLPLEPEVAAVKKWIRSWIQSGRRIDIALDVHSQGQQGELNLLHVPPGTLGGLTEKLNRYWPLEKIDLTFSGSINDCLVNEFHVAAGTFEIPQSAVNQGPYLRTDDYRGYGRGTVRGITDYLFPAGISDKKIN